MIFKIYMASVIYACIMRLFFVRSIICASLAEIGTSGILVTTNGFYTDYKYVLHWALETDCT